MNFLKVRKSFEVNNTISPCEFKRTIGLDLFLSGKGRAQHVE